MGIPEISAFDKIGEGVGSQQDSPKGLAGCKSGLGRDPRPCSPNSFFLSVDGETTRLNCRMVRSFHHYWSFKGTFPFLLEKEFLLSFVKFNLYL